MRRLVITGLLSATLSLSALIPAFADDSASGAAATGESAATGSVATPADGAGGGTNLANTEDAAITERAQQSHARSAHLKLSGLKHKLALRQADHEAARKQHEIAARTKSTGSTADGGADTNKNDSASSTADATATGSGATAAQTSADNSSATSSDTSNTDVTRTSDNDSTGHDKTQLADQPAAGSTSTATPATGSKTGAKKGGAKGSKSSSKVGLGERMAGTVVGTVVGSPIAMARKTWQETVLATRDLVGDTNNKALLGAGGLMGVPAGLLSGTLEGPVYAAINAWKASATDPFGSDSFSLGDMK